MKRMDVATLLLDRRIIERKLARLERIKEVGSTTATIHGQERLEILYLDNIQLKPGKRSFLRQQQRIISSK